MGEAAAAAYARQRNLSSTTKTASLVNDYCDFYDDRLAFSSADGPILLLAIPSGMGEGRRRY